MADDYDFGENSSDDIDSDDENDSNTTDDKLLGESRTAEKVYQIWKSNLLVV